MFFAAFDTGSNAGNNTGSKRLNVMVIGNIFISSIFLLILMIGHAIL